MGISNNNDQLLSNVQECEIGSGVNHVDQNDEESDIEDSDESYLNYLDDSDNVLNKTLIFEPSIDENMVSPDRNIRLFIERIKEMIGGVRNEEPAVVDPRTKPIHARSKIPVTQKRTRRNITTERNVSVGSLPISKIPSKLPLHAGSKIPVTQKKRAANKIDIPPTKTVATTKRTITKSSLVKPSSEIAFGRGITVKKVPGLVKPSTGIAFGRRIAVTAPVKQTPSLTTSEQIISAKPAVRKSVAEPMRRNTVTAAVKKTPSETTSRRIVPAKPAVRKSVAEQMLDYQNKLTPTKLENKLWHYTPGVEQDIPLNYKEFLLERMRRRLGKRYYMDGEEVTEEVPAVKESQSEDVQIAQKIKKPSTTLSVKFSVPTIKKSITKDKAPLGIAFGRRIVAPAAKKKSLPAVKEMTEAEKSELKQAKLEKKIAKQRAKEMLDYQKALTPSKLADELWRFDPNANEVIPENFNQQLLERMRRAIGKRYYAAGDEITEEEPDVEESSSEESEDSSEIATNLPHKATAKRSKAVIPKGVAFGRKVSVVSKEIPGATKRPIPAKPPPRMTVAEKMVAFQKTLTYHKLKEKMWQYDAVKKDLPKNYKDMLLERMRRVIGKRYYPDGEEITVEVPAVVEKANEATKEKSATKVAFGQCVPSNTTVKKTTIKPPGIAFGRRITTKPVREKPVPKIPTPKLTIAEKMQAYQKSLTQEKLKEKLWHYAGVAKDAPKNYKDLLLERMRRNIGKRYYPAGEEITTEVPEKKEILKETPKEDVQVAQKNIVKSAKKINIAKQMVAYQNALTPTKLEENLWQYDPNAEEDIPENFNLQLLQRMRRTIGRRYYAAGEEITEEVPDVEESASEELQDSQNEDVPPARTVPITTVKTSIMKPSLVKPSTGIAFGRKITKPTAVKKTLGVTTARRTEPAKPAARKTVAEEMLIYQNNLTPAKLEKEVWYYNAGTGQDVPKNYKNLLLERMRRGLGKRYYPTGEDVTDEVPGVIGSSSEGLRSTEDAVPSIAMVEIIDGQYQLFAQTESSSDEHTRIPHLVVPRNSSSVAIPKKASFFTSTPRTATNLVSRVAGSTTGAMLNQKPQLIVPNGSSSITIPKEILPTAGSSTGAVPKPIKIGVPVAAPKKVSAIVCSSTGAVSKRLSQLALPKKSSLAQNPKKTPAAGSSTSVVPKQTSRLLRSNIGVPVVVPKKISPVVGSSTGAVPKRLPQVALSKISTQAEIPKKISPATGSSTCAIPKQASQQSNISDLPAIPKKISSVTGPSTGAVPKRLPHVALPKKSTQAEIPKKISLGTSSSSCTVPKQAPSLLQSNATIHAAVPKKIPSVAGSSIGTVPKPLPKHGLTKKNTQAEIPKKISLATGSSTCAVPKQAPRLLSSNISVPAAVPKKISPVASSSTVVVPKPLPQNALPTKNTQAEIPKKISPAACLKATSAIPTQASSLVSPSKHNRIARVTKSSPIRLSNTASSDAVLQHTTDVLLPATVSPVATPKLTVSDVAPTQTVVVPKTTAYFEDSWRQAERAQKLRRRNVPKPIGEKFMSKTRQHKKQNTDPIIPGMYEFLTTKMTKPIVRQHRAHEKIYSNEVPKSVVSDRSPKFPVSQKLCQSEESQCNITPVNMGDLEIDLNSPSAELLMLPSGDPLIPTFRRNQENQFNNTELPLEKPPEKPYRRRQPHKKTNLKPKPDVYKEKDYSKAVPEPIVSDRSPKFPVSQKLCQSEESQCNITTVNMGDLEIDLNSPSAELLMQPSGDSLISMYRRSLDKQFNNTELPLEKPPEKPYRRRQPHKKTNLKPKPDVYKEKDYSKAVPEPIVSDRSSKFPVSQKLCQPEESQCNITTVNMGDLEIDLNSPSAELLMLPSGDPLIPTFRRNQENQFNNTELPLEKPSDKPYRRRQPHKKTNMNPKQDVYKEKDYSKAVPEPIVSDRSPKFPVSQKLCQSEESQCNITTVNMGDLEIDLNSPSAELLMQPSGDSLISMFRRSLDKQFNNTELPLEKPSDKPYRRRQPHKKTNSKPKPDVYKEKDYSKSVPESIVSDRSPKFPVSQKLCQSEESQCNITPVNMGDLEIDLNSPSAELPSGDPLIPTFRRNQENQFNNTELPLEKPSDKPYRRRQPHKKTNMNPKQDVYKEKDYSKAVPEPIVSDRSPKFPVSQKLCQSEESQCNITPVNMGDLEIDLNSPSAELLMLPSGDSLISMYRRSLDKQFNNTELPLEKPPEKSYRRRPPHKKTKFKPNLDVNEEEECIRKT